MTSELDTVLEDILQVRESYSLASTLEGTSALYQPDATHADIKSKAAETQTPEGSVNPVGFSSDQAMEDGERTLSM